jgi:hypothetical protein
MPDTLGAERTRRPVEFHHKSPGFFPDRLASLNAAHPRHGFAMAENKRRKGRGPHHARTLELPTLTKGTHEYISR